MTATPTRYSRVMSGMERNSLALNEIYRYNLVVVIEGQGDIDAAALRDAVSKAAAANPGLRVRLKSFLGFSRWVDSGIAPPMHHHEGPADWDYRTERNSGFINQRFDALGGGHIADVHLVSGKTTSVVFRTLHAATDGGGMHHWVGEVFRALRGEVLLGSTSTITDFEIARRYRKEYRQHRKASSGSEPPTYAAALPASPHRDAAVHYVWRTVNIPRPINNALPRLAVLVREHASRHTDGDIGFTIPVDLRGSHDNITSTANLTGYLRILVEGEDTPRTVMKKIADQIREHREHRSLLESQALRWVSVQYLARRMKKYIAYLLYETNAFLPTAGLVSLGRVDPRNYDAPGFIAEKLTGIPGSVGKLNIVTMTLPHETVLTLSAPAPYNHEGQLDSLAKHLAEAFSA